MSDVAVDDSLLSVRQVEDYVRLFTEVCDGIPIIDVHVHATEVVFDRLRYRSPNEPILSVSGPDRYKKPIIEPVRLRTPEKRLKQGLANRFAVVSMEKLYQFSGVSVLSDQMTLAGIDRAVLLPVSHKDHSLLHQMDVIKACCESNSCFIAGYSVHDSVPESGIENDIQAAVSDFGIRIVKIHTNFSKIDASAKSGQKRLNLILYACNRLNMPVVFHGGESPVLGDRPERKFGVIENLVELDWQAISSPVVIAHFGVYGSNDSSGGIPAEQIRSVRRLLDAHENIFLDTSGVPYPTILKLMQVVDPLRLVFGSDALYVPMYRQVALVMHAMTNLRIDINAMRNIASQNATAILNYSSLKSST